MTYFYTQGQAYALTALGLCKEAATAIMKELAPAAKAFMQRMTGFTGNAPIPQNPTARRLRQTLTGRGTPEIITEMHMEPILTAPEQALKSQARQHYESTLRAQGKVIGVSKPPKPTQPTPLSSMNASNPVTSITRADLPSQHLGHAQTVAAPRVPY